MCVCVCVHSLTYIVSVSPFADRRNMCQKMNIMPAVWWIALYFYFASSPFVRSFNRVGSYHYTQRFLVVCLFVLVLYRFYFCCCCLPAWAAVGEERERDGRTKQNKKKLYLRSTWDDLALSFTRIVHNAIHSFVHNVHAEWKEIIDSPSLSAVRCDRSNILVFLSVTFRPKTKNRFHYYYCNFFLRSFYFVSDEVEDANDSMFEWKKKWKK